MRRVPLLNSPEGSSDGKYYVIVDCGKGPFLSAGEALLVADAVQREFPGRRFRVVKEVAFVPGEVEAVDVP